MVKLRNEAYQACLKHEVCGRNIKTSDAAIFNEIVQYLEQDYSKMPEAKRKWVNFHVKLIKNAFT